MEEIIYLILGVFAGSLALLLGRDFIKGRVPDDNDSIGELRDSIGEAGKVNTESGERIDAAQEITGSIKQDNTDARDGIKTARDILEAAKKRTDDEAG